MLNTPAARIDSLPPLYGGGGGMTPGGNTPASTRDHQGPRIIVGNALAGDTIDVCDYLDAGDGVQLQAAITAASVPTNKYDVWVRPGFIQLSAPITVANFVTVRFADIGSVVQVSTLDRRGFILGTGASLYNLRLQVTTPAPGATGDTLVQIGVLCTLRDCWFTASAYSAATADESLRYFVRAPVAATSAVLTNVYITMPNFQQSGLPQNMTGVSLVMSTTDNSPVELVNCNTTNGDVGFECQGNALMSGCTTQASMRRGIVLSTVNTGSYKQVVSGCRVQVFGTNTVDRAGIEVVTGSRPAGASVIIDACSVTNVGAAPATAAGVRLSGTGYGTILSACAIDAFPLGLTVAAGQAEVSAKGTIRGATTPVTDASGSLLNEMRVI